MEKRIMILTKHFTEIISEQFYSVSEAARYFKVHRCTIYAYINHPTKPLPSVKLPNKKRIVFQGADLIAYKAAGLPKRGRKPKLVNF